MEKRFVLFLVLSFGILLLHFATTAKQRKPRPKADAAKTEEKEGKDAKAQADEAKTKDAEPKKDPAPQIAPAKPAPDADKIPSKWVTLGSADPDDPYRMLVTLSSLGATLARAEFSSPRYHELEDRSGYLGHLVVDETIRDKTGKGCPVQVVGAGTPAAAAKLEAGDVITAIDGKAVRSAAELDDALAKTRPKQRIELTVARGDDKLTLEAMLGWRPLEIIRPNKGPKANASDPLSLRLTLAQLDDVEREMPSLTVAVGEEIAGLHLWDKNWELLPGADQEHASFQRVVASEKGEAMLRIVKTFRLAEVPPEALGNPDYPAYHLEVEIAIHNESPVDHTVAYQLDGPNGLPTEGAWYASKVSRTGGAAGLRDMLVRWEDGKEPVMVNGPAIAEDTAEKSTVEKPWEGQVRYIGVDTQYFAAVLVPQSETSFHKVHPLRMGDVDAANYNLNNTSFRLVGNSVALAGKGETGDSLTHKFLLFAGPKRPDLLANPKYKLDEVVYYGNPVFAVVAKPLVLVLHVLYAGVSNYGLAIIMLTALVRLCMFPMSRKQAVSMQKMQVLQPEMKKIQEKYKKDPQARNRAMQELYRKHNYNPFGGCLVMLIQLPIFIGLYRALSVDVELRQAPLLPFAETLRWCSNLAAPDMLYDWSWLMPGWISSGKAIYSLGPYFNLLPVLTIAMFIYQQKKFMPPPADEQAAMQQKIMKYMMVVMGVLFYKVASGLCIYFIASSVFGIVERRFMPKPAPAGGAGKPETRADAKAREKAVQEATQKAAQKTAADRDRAAEKKKERDKFRKRRR